MKRYITLIMLLSSCFAYSQAPTLALRNSLLGIYSGQYYDYAVWPVHVDAGVKLTALPGDSAGIIFEDTINNVFDTISFFFTHDINGNINDTILYNYAQNCGILVQQYDSIYYGRYVPNGAISAVSEHWLKCVNHSFPTLIDEMEKTTVNIYPNPSTEQLFITAEVGMFKNYHIYNIYGQTVSSGAFNSMLDIRNLPPGMYYLKLTGKMESMHPFIKTN